MSGTRTAATASVAATGLVLIGVVLNALLAGRPSLPGLLVAGLGLAVGAALLVAAGWLFRSDLTAGQALRVAGWNALGVVAIGAAVTIIYAYQATTGSPVSDPYFSGSVLVGVSAVAHVLIGINDVRRIRAEDLARERLKFSVLSRVVRHDLRTHSQVLLGYAERLSEAEPAPDDPAAPDGAAGPDDPADAAEGVRTTAADLVDIHGEMKTIQRVLDEPEARRRFDVSDLVAEVVSDARAAHPDATITAGPSSSVAVEAHPDLPAALREVVDNAVEHDPADATEVSVAVRQPSADRVELAVADDGPGIPDDQRDLVLGDAEVTQLRHGNGLGLWLVKWTLDASDGTLDIDADDGTTVRICLPAAG